MNNYQNQVSFFFQTLILSGNVLIEYPRMKLNELSTLDLSNNDFSILPEQLDINLMPNLRHLSLSGNPIRKIKFENILSLETLEINDMSRLTEISGLENIRNNIIEPKRYEIFIIQMF